MRQKVCPAALERELWLVLGSAGTDVPVALSVEQILTSSLSLAQDR